MRLSQAVRMMKLTESTNGQGDKVRDTWVEGLAGRCAGASRREGRREAEVPSRDWTLGMMSSSGGGVGWVRVQDNQSQTIRNEVSRSGWAAQECSGAGACIELADGSRDAGGE